MRLNKKIILATLSILLASLLASAVVNLLGFRKNYTEALITGSYGLGQSLNSVVSEMLFLGLPLETLSGMNKKLKQLVENNPYIIYAEVADLDGKVLFHNDPDLVGRQLTDAVMKRSTATLEPITQLYPRFDGHEYYDVTIPIFAAGKEHVGVIRLGFRVEVIDDKVNLAILQVALNFALTFAIIGFLINYLLVRFVSQPVIALSEQARRISRGDFDSEVQVKRQDEIGVLSDSLNLMARTIKNQLAALQRSRDELEELVRQRTHELASTNRELAERNRELQAKTAALTTSNADLDQFAYSVSHDMRQPLRMIAGHLQLLERALRGQLDEDTRENLKFALEGAQRMNAMIVSLLDYSRVGRKSDAEEILASRESLDEALGFLAPSIEETQASVEVNGEWPALRASRNELTRLFQNLLGNALHYHEPGQAPRIEVDSSTLLDAAGNSLWRVSIRDHGIGIDPQQIGRLFQFFSRLQTRERFEGTGMGLALCRRIVEHYQGRIWVESAGTGQGSCFVLEIPLNQELRA